MKRPELRACLKNIKPYVPGKPVGEVERELGLKDVIKIASNENALGPSPLAVEAMKRNSTEMHTYPDGNCFYLKQALAADLQIKTDQVILGNGSDELLMFITLAYINPGDEAIMVSPSFSEYDFSMYLMGGTPKHVPLAGDDFQYDVNAIREAITAKTKIIYICSPNNPTGTIVHKKDLDQLVKNLPDGVLLVMDQAYHEYVEEPDHPCGIDYVKEGYPVIALRTFSKIYGLAGLRIGYGVAASGIIEDLNRVREPFNVNAMAQAAALAALEDKEHLVRSCELVNEGRKQITTGLAELGLKPIRDHANFFFVDIKVDSKQAFQALLKKGVIVRTGDIFGYPTYIRVTYGTREQNERFLKALKEVLSELS